MVPEPIFTSHLLSPFADYRNLACPNIRHIARRRSSGRASHALRPITQLRIFHLRGYRSAGRTSPTGPERSGMLRLRTLGPGTFLTTSRAVSIASARDTDVTTPKPILMAVASLLA